MKIFYNSRLHKIAFLLFVTIGFGFSASASHYSGGALTYTYLAPNQYEVRLEIYRDCNGIAVGSSQIVNYSSAACGVNSSLTLNIQV